MAMTDTIPTSRVTPRPSARTRSVWLWQLSLGAVVIVLTLAIVLLSPAMLVRTTMAAGIALVLTLTIATLILPWERASRPAISLIPLADIVAIGLLAYGGELFFGFLWVFPLAWIATHYSPLWVVGSLGLVAAMILADALTQPPSAFSSLRFLVVLLSMTFLAITITASAGRTRAFTRLVRRQSARLESTLERVRSQERRVIQMLNGLDAAIARVDREGRLLGVNDAYVALYGIDPRDASRPPTSVEYDERGGTALAATERPAARAARGEIVSGERLWLFDADGRWHIVSASTRSLVSGPAEPETTLLVISDVTEAVEAENARRTLATTVTHELANPLTAIVGYTDLLLESDLPPAAHERLELIEAAGSRMERLIAEVLRAGGRSAASDPRRRVDARTLLEATVESFLPAASAGDVLLTLLPGPPVPITADAFRLRQVLDNVVSNAVKYTPRAGSVTVTADRDGTDAVITVTDTGIGISARDLPLVFEDYFRAETARDSGIPGTGLGMGISRAIVEEHAGSLTIRSRPGAGTTISLRLPLSAPEEV